MKKLILLGLIFSLLLLGSVGGFIKPLKGEIEPIETEKNIGEAMVMWTQNLCTATLNGWYDDSGAIQSYYNGDLLTEEAGTCNASIRQFRLTFEIPIDANLTISVPPLPLGMTYPNGLSGTNYQPGLIWRIGRYIQADFNWNKPTDYCYVETYTPRHKTGQLFPIDNSTGNTYDQSKFLSSIFRYQDNEWTLIGGGPDTFRLVVENSNRPLTDFETDKNSYILLSGQNELKIKLNITDEDLSCGKPGWAGWVTSIWFDSGEIFEITVDGNKLDSRDHNSGAFGAVITGTNQGEITITYDMTDYAPGEHEFEITVTDVDGYHPLIDGYPVTIGELIVEDAGNTTITKTIPVFKQGTSVCVPTYNKHTGLWEYCNIA